MIVGFNIESIEAEKGKSASGDVQVNYRPEIKDVTAEDVSALDGEAAKVEFEFAVRYMAGETQTAHITMEGNVLWKGMVDEVVESWEEDGEIPDRVNVPLMNEMYKKLLSESVGVADSLNLLPPIPTPTVERQD